MTDDKTLIVELSPASAHMVESMFEQSRKREEGDTRYMKEAASYVEVLLDYAIKRKLSEWKSRDQQQVGKVLREALDKLVNGKPLTREEAKLVATFKAAAEPQGA